MNEEEKFIIKTLKDSQNAYIENTKVKKVELSIDEAKVVLNLIEKQFKEIEELKKQLDLDNECEIALNNKIMDLENADKKWKNKIKEILGIEEDIDNEKLLSLLQTIIDENVRLEDIEDRKVQIEYNNVFNKGVKSVEDKIKAILEEYKYTEIGDSEKIIEFYKKMQSLLEKE